MAATGTPAPTPVGIYTAVVVGSRVRMSKIPMDSFAETMNDDRAGSVEVQYRSVNVCVTL